VRIAGILRRRFRASPPHPEHQLADKSRQPGIALVGGETLSGAKCAIWSRRARSGPAEIDRRDRRNRRHAHRCRRGAGGGQRARRGEPHRRQELCFWPFAFLKPQDSRVAAQTLATACRDRPERRVGGSSEAGCARPWRAGPTPRRAADPIHLIAHPAAVAVTLPLIRLAPRRCVAQIFEPASEQGQRGVDELQHQVIGLLSFKPFRRPCMTRRLLSTCWLDTAKTLQ